MRSSLVIGGTLLSATLLITANYIPQPHHNPHMTTTEQNEEDLQEAIQFATGNRGQFILSQALVIAIRSLEEVEPPEMRELSNIQDMKYLRDRIYNIYARVEGAKAMHLGELEKIKKAQLGVHETVNEELLRLCPEEDVQGLPLPSDDTPQ